MHFDTPSFCFNEFFTKPKQRAMALYDRHNEVVVFLINLFLLETLGRLVVRAVIWLFRLFGMPQLYVAFHNTPNAGHWVSTVLLLVAVAISVTRVLKMRRGGNEE